MVDPTAWANVRLPQHNIAGSFLGGLAAGQKMRQRGQEMRMRQEAFDIKKADIADQKAKEQAIANAGKMVLDSYRTGNMKDMQQGLREYAALDVDGATEMQNYLGNLDKTNLSGAGLNVYAAAASPDPETQVKLLRTALERERANPNSPLLGQIQKAMDAEPGEERMAEMAGLVKTYQALGGIPGAGEEDDIESRKLAMREREMLAKQEQFAQTLEQRKTEQSAREEQEQWERKQLSPTVQKILEKVDEDLYESDKMIGSYESLAQDMDRLQGKVTGGVQRTARQWLEDVTGSQDATSLLYTKYRGIRGSHAIRNLPKGPASDRDIQIAMTGTPPENAPPEYIASWLRGVSKMERINREYLSARSQWISEKRGQQGFTEYWNQNRDRHIGAALGMSQSQVRGKPAETGAGNLKEKSIDDLLGEFTGQTGEIAEEMSDAARRQYRQMIGR